MFGFCGFVIQPCANLLAPGLSVLVNTKFLWHTFASLSEQRSQAFALDLCQWRNVGADGEHNGPCPGQAGQRMMFGAQE